MRQPSGHVFIQRDLIAAARDHDGQQALAARPQQEGQAIQRRAVRPVHVLHHQPDRRPAGHRPQQLRYPGKQPLPLPPPARAALLSRAAPQPWHQARHLGAHIGRSLAQRRLHQPAILQPAQLTQRLHHRQQRQLLRQRQASPPHRHHPTARGPAHRLPDKPGLAHARIPHHQQQPPIPGQNTLETGQLTPPADEPRRAIHQPTPPASNHPVNPHRQSRLPTSLPGPPRLAHHPAAGAPECPLCVEAGRLSAIADHAQIGGSARGYPASLASLAAGS